MFERFTEPARQVVVVAQDEARALEHNHIGTEHILLGLLREEGVAARVLESLDITVEEVRAQVARIVARIVGQGDEVTTGQIPFTPRAKKVLELALREAFSLGHNYIGTEHILLGLVRENEGVAARILLDFDADAETIRDQTLASLGLKEVPRGEERVVFPSQGHEQTAWTKCAKCDGSAFAGQHCLAHANGGERKAALAAIGSGAAVDLRGVEITAALLESVLSAAPMSEGHVVLVSALFDGAIFPGGTSFERVIFNGVSFKRARLGEGSSFEGAFFGPGWVEPNSLADVFTENRFHGADFGGGCSFAHAVFTGPTSFDDAVFGDRCTFDTATFEREVSFRRTRFGDNARFAGVRWSELASFAHATFGQSPTFTGATLGPGTEFREASFGDRPTFAGAALGEGFGFDGAAFGDEASFERARLGANGSFRASSFGGGAVFRNASFEGDVSFARSRFGDDAQVGPFAVGGQISFEQALVGLGARMEVAADRVVCTGLNAPHGLTLRARWSEVELDSAQFGAASIVSGSDTPFDGVDESKVQAATGTGASARPRILTLANSDVQHLLLADIDLSNCRFLGARNLDKLLLERPLSLPRTPPGVHHGRALPPVWRWTRRETLPEEHEWRQGTRKKAGWRTPAAREAPAMKRDDANAVRRALQTLRGARERLEARHRIRITDEALGAAALLTLRHVTDEDVSGRSLEVMTAAAVRASGTAPVPSAQRDGPGEELRRTIAAVREEKEAAIDAQEFERAAALRDKERKLTFELREIGPSFPRWGGPNEEQPEIGGEEVVQLLSSWVGLPVETLLAELDDEDDRAQSTVPSAPPTPRERRVDAGQVASLYRSLRKGREDNKDEPGAADFYYGEMEMRRKAAQPGSVERALLTIYWAASGYGLRASRAFALLLAALVLHTFLVVHWGFSHHLSLGRSITFTVSNALLRGSGHAQLTVWGEVLQISLRLLGPLLLALTLLSVRGRLKR